MSHPIYLSFADFWSGFDHNHNFFKYLCQSVNPAVEVIPLGPRTNILIYSCFGNSHHGAASHTRKIFYTGENIRPDYGHCHQSLTFDFGDYGGRNVRLPLWLLQIDWFGHSNYGNPNFLIHTDSIDDNLFSRKPKTKFCCTVFNNPSPFRHELVEKLSRYKPVDCYGHPFDNHFSGENRKLEIISDYRFTICLENSSHPGYYTEKPIHAKVAGCIPIYWSDREYVKDFNKKAFIHLADYKNLDDMVDFIVAMDKDEAAYQVLKSQSLFSELPNIDYLLPHFKAFL